MEQRHKRADYRRFETDSMAVVDKQRFSRSHLRRPANSTDGNGGSETLLTGERDSIDSKRASANRRRNCWRAFVRGHYVSIDVDGAARKETESLGGDILTRPETKARQGDFEGRPSRATRE